MNGMLKIRYAALNVSIIAAKFERKLQVATITDKVRIDVQHMQEPSTL